jgi:thioredoxin-like negative regulator of GroEL
LTPIETFTDGDWPQVLASPLPVVACFWAEWCLPSRGMQAALDAVAPQLEGRVRLGLLNVDQSPHTVRRHAVRGLPTLLMLRQGRETLRRVGLVGLQDLLSLLESGASS